MLIQRAKPEGEPLGQRRAQRVGERVARGALDHVGRRPLQHHDMGGAAGERGDDRHRRRAAADHQHPLADVVDVVGPALRIDDAAAEAFEAGKVRPVAALVAVIAGADDEEAAGQLDLPPLRPGFDLQGPARLGRRPCRRAHLVAEADSAIDAELAGGVADVGEDRPAAGDRRRMRPRPERIAQREHFGVGTHAGIAEQVPGAAEVVARLEDGEARARTASPQPAGRANSR